LGEWTTLDSVSVQLDKIRAELSIIQSEPNSKSGQVVRLVSVKKIFKAVAFKPEDWERILPVLTRMVQDAKNVTTQPLKPDQTTQRTQSVAPDSFYSQEETDRKKGEKP